MPELNLQEKIFLYPTDTTFGMGCEAFNQPLVEKINQIKHRKSNQNFILLVASASKLMDLVKVPDVAWDVIELSNKPITIVYDNPISVPHFLLSKEGTIAIRITQNNHCRKIIQKLKSPIISTSANITGEKTPKNFKEISEKIIQNIDYILPECKTFVPQHQASSIIEIKTNGIVKVIRA